MTRTNGTNNPSLNTVRWNPADSTKDNHMCQFVHVTEHT